MGWKKKKSEQPHYTRLINLTYEHKCREGTKCVIDTNGVSGGWYCWSSINYGSGCVYGISHCPYCGVDLGVEMEGVGEISHTG